MRLDERRASILIAAAHILKDLGEEQLATKEKADGAKLVRLSHEVQQFVEANNLNPDLKDIVESFFFYVLEGLEPQDEEAVWSLMAPIAQAAAKAGMFIDVFSTRLYYSGESGCAHIVCNHEGTTEEDTQKSYKVWETISEGLQRLIQGECPQDDVPMSAELPVLDNATPGFEDNVEKVLN